MTLDTLLAVTALLVAIYQIMPRARQLELSFRLRRLDKAVVILALGIILYLQFYSVFASVGFTPRFGLARWSITPERASFLVLLAVALVLLVRMRTARLAAGQIHDFKTLVDELVAVQAFHELSLLLEANYARLAHIADRRLPSSRARAFLSASPAIVVNEALSRLPNALVTKVLAKEEISESEEREIREALRVPTRVVLSRWIGGVGHLIGHKLAAVFPDHQREEDEAREALERALGSREFATHVALTKPYLGLRLLSEEQYATREFLGSYVRALMLNPSSVLYAEISATQNKRTGPAGNCEIPESCRILRYFLDDAKVAERVSLWTPIGETMISELDRLGSDSEHDDYNTGPDLEFETSGMARSPLFAGVFLYELMVTQALVQNVQWHMWMWDFPTFTARVVRNYSPRGRLVDTDSAFSTRYSWFLRELFATLELWIRAIEHLPREQANLVLKDSATEHENGNIPKSAIFVLSQCLTDVLESATIETQLAVSIANDVLELYFRLDRIDPAYAHVLATMIRPTRVYASGTGLYRERLRMAFNGLDRFRYQEKVGQLETELFSTSD